jgi:glyoxylate carboligase
MEVILERVTNIAMGTEIDNVVGSRNSLKARLTLRRLSPCLTEQL